MKNNKKDVIKNKNKLSNKLINSSEDLVSKLYEQHLKKVLALAIIQNKQLLELSSEMSINIEQVQLRNDIKQVNKLINETKHTYCNRCSDLDYLENEIAHIINLISKYSKGDNLVLAIYISSELLDYIIERLSQQLNKNNAKGIQQALQEIDI